MAVVISADIHGVIVRGKEIHLTPDEFAIAKHLSDNRKRYVRTRELCGVLGHDGCNDNCNRLAVAIHKVRKKIKPSSIENLPWVGYRYKP